MRHINYIHEPTHLQCGQAVLAMVIGKTVEEIIKELDGNERETNLAEMRKIFSENNFKIEKQRQEANNKKDLPALALLSLETPECWHWSLFANGIFYDPQRGVMEDFPYGTKRKFFWQILDMN